MDKQQFLILGKSARGRALAELINRATAEPGIFTFGELLSLPNVQEVGFKIAQSGRTRSWSAEGQIQNSSRSRHCHLCMGCAELLIRPALVYVSCEIVLVIPTDYQQHSLQPSAAQQGVQPSADHSRHLSPVQTTTPAALS